MKKIFLALCVCAGLCACSDDVIDGVGSSSSISLDGNDVYLTVRLNDVNSATRASVGDPAYTNGTAAEYAVNDAYFYFYDENGDFVSRAEVWEDGEVNTTDENIEFNGNTVIVLKGLTDTKFPRYMVTVLNEPSGFEESPYYEPAGTLAEFQAKLSSTTDVGIYNSTTTAGLPTNFVMSTSAYNAPTYTGQWVEDGTEVSPWFFVTPINEANFSLEPIGSTTTSPVNVYVERLAAKVEVDVNSTLSQSAQTLSDGTDNHFVYSLEESIAGVANEDDTEVVFDDPITGEPTDELEGTDHLYIEFLGWALNGTARRSNIVKDITKFGEPGEPNDIDGWPASSTSTTNVWNNPTYFRSYWGASYNYGIDHTYPTTNVKSGNTVPNVDEDEDDASTWLDDYLKYTSLLEGNLYTIGDTYNSITPTYEYCAENTNTPEVLGDKRSSGITNALIKARIWTDEVDDEGNLTGNITYGNIIRFEGMLFTESAFQEYIVRRVDVDGGVSQYHWMSNSGWTPTLLDYDETYTLAELDELGLDTLTWTSLDYSMLELKDEGDGILYVELNYDDFDQTSTLFFVSIGVVDGVERFRLVDADDVEGAFEDAEDALEVINASYEINGYADGMMYYAIPIEHLNNVTEDNPLPDDQNILEAQYGIVRNHWYQLSIDDLTQVGKGIWNEEDVIIPDPTDPQFYYVEASINILSWHMVSQGVDL